MNGMKHNYLEMCGFRKPSCRPDTRVRFEARASARSEAWATTRLVTELRRPCIRRAALQLSWRRVTEPMHNRDVCAWLLAACCCWLRLALLAAIGSYCLLLANGLRGSGCTSKCASPHPVPSGHWSASSSSRPHRCDLDHCRAFCAGFLRFCCGSAGSSGSEPATGAASKAEEFCALAAATSRRRRSRGLPSPLRRARGQPIH